MEAGRLPSRAASLRRCEGPPWSRVAVIERPLLIVAGGLPQYCLFRVKIFFLYFYFLFHKWCVIERYG